MRPARMRSSVVLPAPFAPTSEASVPASRSRSTESSTRASAPFQRLDTLRTTSRATSSAAVGRGAGSGNERTLGSVPTLTLHPRPVSVPRREAQDSEPQLLVGQDERGCLVPRADTEL